MIKKGRWYSGSFFCSIVSRQKNYTNYEKRI